MSGEEFGRTARVNRRKFIAGVGTGITLGTTGRLVEGSAGDTETSRDQPQQGGQLVFAAGSPPEILNPLAASDAYSGVILDAVYDPGVVFHPRDLEIVPWAFTDWEIQDVESGEPTAVVQLRDDMSFTDGEDLTAEDVVFTVEYVLDQEPAGSLSASQFEAVDNVEASGDYEVTYDFTEPYAAWEADVLGAPILPQHRWEDVDDYSKHTPREEGGPVGSGAWVLDDFNWEEWFTLTPRENVHEEYPLPQDADFLQDDAPFLDEFRYEVFGSQTALVQAIFGGQVHVPYGTVPVDKAVEAVNDDNLDVIESGDNGWNHISWNLRRVPFDDKAFRQTLVLAWDEQKHVEDIMQGIGAIDGDLAAPAAYQEFRPVEPDAEEVERFKMPRTDEDTFDYEATREFLVEHEDATHDFSFEEAVTDVTTAPDDLELYVNGEPLVDAHTDNDGNPEQGPLEFSLNPPRDQPLNFQSFQNWVDNLHLLGIPVSLEIESFSSQLPKVYQNENFDMFEMGWTNMAPDVTYLDQLFGEAGADLDGTSDSTMFNAMGYTGAQDFIDEQKETMDSEERKPIVGDALMQIYEDCPTQIFQYEQVLQPVSQDFEGWVESPGGVRNPFTWLNVRQA